MILKSLLHENFNLILQNHVETIETFDKELRFFNQQLARLFRLYLPFQKLFFAYVPIYCIAMFVSTYAFFTGFENMSIATVSLNMYCKFVRQNFVSTNIQKKP